MPTMNNWSIDLSPLLPPTLLWTGVAVAAVLLVPLLLRRRRGTKVPKTTAFRATAAGKSWLAPGSAGRKHA
jgi:hypothetical protein